MKHRDFPPGFLVEYIYLFIVGINADQLGYDPHRTAAQVYDNYGSQSQKSFAEMAALHDIKGVPMDIQLHNSLELVSDIMDPCAARSAS